MKIILKPRQTGKTTELIKLASKDRYKLIVCMNRLDVERIWKLAQRLKEDNIIQKLPLHPITYQEFLKKKICQGLLLNTGTNIN